MEAEYRTHRIGWETAGRCVNRALNDIESERSRQLVNHDTNTVVWRRRGIKKCPDTVLQAAHTAAGLTLLRGCT